MHGGHVITILCPLSLQPVISFLSFTRCGTFSAIMAKVKPLKFSGETTKTNFVELREASDTLYPRSVQCTCRTAIQKIRRIKTGL